MQAAHSHTAALIGNYETYDAVFRQFGFTAARTLKDMLNYAKIFSQQPLSTGNRVAILTNGGGMGVLATDALCRITIWSWLRCQKTSEATLRKLMPPIVNIRMPLDIAGDADDKRFGDALEVVEADPNVDALMVVALFQTPGADSRVAAKRDTLRYRSKKPMVVIMRRRKLYRDAQDHDGESGVPVYSSPNDAASALCGPDKLFSLQAGGMIRINSRIRSIIARDKAIMFTTSREQYPFVVESASGDYAYDVAGNKFIDFSSFISVYMLGDNANAGDKAGGKEAGRQADASRIPRFLLREPGQVRRKACRYVP